MMEKLIKEEICQGFQMQEKKTMSHGKIDERMCLEKDRSRLKTLVYSAATEMLGNSLPHTFL